MGAKKWRQGKIDSVPCPHCGRPNDFRDTDEFLFDPMTGASAVKSDKPTFACDHCSRIMEVVHVEKTIIVAVRKPD